ncbi:efflux RND transporter periplasmic adaptor subunit [Dyadobacter fanqingshengii]|uniref:Efflux RND transporter periplasmic adaptor subunit n=1 Tax=Dyadobacter fanqingshengii TaxID=2906443 RepID=A0A9X1PC72_9BACT|nr:efflux RND transporter periplasmic adaptor subunit [Dyadobacter fanqingshengii]MCF0042541.1 efflux RND transporter periplasmic adaptor subunit [Dyadobacter fanqingshengii]USJ36231.1 efflux RND transporter periplasmic adaptor subunit [Dyadobacter fanqingshengii]
MFSNKLPYFSAALFLGMMSSCGNKNKQQQQPTAPPAVPVSLVAVSTADAVYYDEYPGTVTALNEIELRPQVTGFITGIHFKDGSRVRKGQLLYSIDAQLYNANYDQAVANLNVQQANLSRAQKDADRYHELEKNDAVAKQLVDNADAALEVAKRQAEAAKANIQAVQTSVNYTKVTAPFDGVIGISLVKVGAAISAGQTILNTVSTDSQLAVDFNVDQKEIYRFSTLMKNAKAADSTFTLKFGTDIFPATGKIALIDRAVDPQTGTIKTRLVFPNKDNRLRSGMSGTVRVLNNSAAKSVVIPYKAVTEQLGEYFVYVAGDSSKVSQRRVVLGNALGANVIVKDGLKEGEKIAVEGVQNLREGAVITAGK